MNAVRFVNAEPHVHRPFNFMYIIFLLLLIPLLLAAVLANQSYN